MAIVGAGVIGATASGILAVKTVNSTAGRAIIVFGGFLVGAAAAYYIITN